MAGRLVPAAGRLKPPPERLYGRSRSRPPSTRQGQLIAEVLPRLRFAQADCADPRAAFGTRVAEVWLEVGFGAGEHALAIVRARPEIGLIASEVFANGIASLLSALVPHGGAGKAALPGNLRLWDDDARALIRMLPSRSIGRLFLMFPDPWPKQRHVRRRFVHPLFIPEVARILAPGSEWRIASDDPVHQAWLGEVLAGQDLFAVAPPFCVRPAEWPPTRYEAKALTGGRRVLYWRLVRRG
ncbi:MAG: tRNA (guanine(46)-N(7))-methyltransferase TrmB [Acetobacteraceae bacterium]